MIENTPQQWVHCSSVNLNGTVKMYGRVIGGVYNNGNIIFFTEIAFIVWKNKQVITQGMWHLFHVSL